MRSQAGFTIIEILTVVAVIGIIVVTVWPYLNDARNDAEVANAQTEAKEIAKAVQKMNFHTGAFPFGCDDANDKSDMIHTSDLGAPNAGIVQRPDAVETTIGGVTCEWTGNEASDWDGSYMRTIPNDPWNNAYEFDPQYTNSECDVPEGVAIVSKGPDQEKGTCKDIVRYITTTDDSGDRGNFYFRGEDSS